MQRGYTMRDVQFWVLVFGLGTASMFIFSVMYATQPLLPLYTEQFGVSVLASSMTMSVMTVGLMIGLLVVGLCSDRYGRFQFVIGSLILSALPFFIIPFVTYFPLIIVLRFFQGVALAGVPAVGLAYLNEEIHPKFQSVATSLYISCNGIGGMGGRIFTGMLAERYTWELAFLILGSIGMLVFLVLRFTLPRSRHFEPSVEPIRHDVNSFLYHARNPNLLVIFGLGFVLQLSFTGTWTYLPFYLADEPFHLSLDTISLTYAAYSFGIIGAPVASFLAARYTIKRVRVLALFLLSFGIIVTLSSSFMTVVIGMCIVCASFFTAHSLTATTVSQEAKHHKGSASSLYLVAYYIGVAVGSTGLSPIWEQHSWFGIVIFTASVPLVYYVALRAYETWKRRTPTST